MLNVECSQRVDPTHTQANVVQRVPNPHATLHIHSTTPLLVLAFPARNRSINTLSRSKPQGSSATISFFFSARQSPKTEELPPQPRRGEKITVFYNELLQQTLKKNTQNSRPDEWCKATDSLQTGTVLLADPTAFTTRRHPR